jgi:WhiB family transcriptional regulator, redox-sensing transcriptional regulator
MAPSSERVSSAIERERLSFAATDGQRWQQRARCQGLPSDVFFPEEQDSRRLRRAQEAAAKQICAGCPVIAACREHALRSHEKYGVWGALTARERFAHW